MAATITPTAARPCREHRKAVARRASPTVDFRRARGQNGRVKGLVERPEGEMAPAEQGSNRSAPPLPAIQAFIAATGAPSFRAAAQELGLSPSAFSRRISSLEGFLGGALYDRSGPRPRLTEAGERYRRSLAPVMAALYQATAVARAPAPGDRLRLSCPPSLAANWLMPRLRTWFDLQGRQTVDLVIDRDVDAVRLGRAHLGVVLASEAMNGLEGIPLLRLRGAIVSAPSLAGGLAPPRDLAALQTCPILALDRSPDVPHDLWPGWLNGAGRSDLRLREPTRFATWTLMYEAAANGLGVAVAVPAIAESYLENQRLTPCFASDVPLDAAYSLVFASRALRLRPAVRALTRWLVDSMAGSLDAYGRLTAVQPADGPDHPSLARGDTLSSA